MRQPGASASVRSSSSVLAETRKRYPLKGTPEERAKLADHSYLYGPDGLPR